MRLGCPNIVVDYGEGGTLHEVPRNFQEGQEADLVQIREGGVAYAVAGNHSGLEGRSHCLSQPFYHSLRFDIGLRVLFPLEFY